ncbi:MAG: transposase [Cyanobacteria bacterium REEB444]|nr:transposase [Cyanobacteria bacterium REEB444]
MIDKSILQRLQEIVAHTCEKWSSQLTYCIGESDHVHLVEISKVVNTLKTIFSRLIRKAYADGINQIRVSQCSGLEPIALPVVAALLWIRSKNMVKINGKSQTNGSLVALRAVWWKYPTV